MGQGDTPRQARSPLHGPLERDNKRFFIFYLYGVAMQRLLPPLLFALLLIPVLLLHRWTAGPGFPTPVWLWAVPLGLGLAGLMAARVQFTRSDSEIMTFDTPRNMVTGGAFGVSRNPMYLGFLLILLAAALSTGSIWALAAPAVFFAACHWWYIPAEEANMKATFGATYAAYAARVRRWL
jgi:protein-S-isoprenylcysteine O-methyltransferase Ste14